MSLQDQIATYRIHFGGEMTAEKAEEVVGKWRAAAQAKEPGEDVELAAPFQRHYTNFGTGLPPNVCVVLTPSEVLAFKFDPRNTKHPLDVRPGQLKKLAARWPREAARVTQVASWTCRARSGGATARPSASSRSSAGPRPPSA